MDFKTLWRDSIGFWRVWIATIGRRHGLLEALPAREDRLPRELGLAPGPVALWADAAVALGLVRRGAGRLRPAPGVGRLLVDRSHPDYLAGHLMYGAIRSLDYDAFGPFLEKGRALDLLKRPRRNEAVEEATHWDHVMFLRKLPAPVRSLLRRGCDALELGCGTGRWLQRMRKEFPRSRFRGADPDPEAAAAAGAEVGWAESYGETASADLVYLGEVLHLTDRPKALANAARVLRPGGWLLVLEGFMPEKVSTRPMESVLFAMQLDQALQGVRFMKRSELVLPAGFGRARYVTLGGCVALAVARRLAT